MSSLCPPSSSIIIISYNYTYSSYHTTHPKMPTPRTFTLNLIGDVMLGRLVDQLWPQHVDNAREQRIISNFIDHHPYLASYSHHDPWGTTLPLFHSADLNLINLETSATTSNTPWPNKAFNYRMHPANAIAALSAARIDYVCLANNHTLDYGTDGLTETTWTVKKARIPFAGAGETTDESRRPAILSLPRPATASATPEDRELPVHSVHVYSAADHPRDWAVVPTFHMIDYSAASRRLLKNVLTAAWPSPAADGSGVPKERGSPALKVFSVHWGPNYRWMPAAEIRGLAHFVIDECGVDVVHGHSAHHVQGVERYKGKLIVYGCGDFVDDYALNEEFRNDLGAVWRVVVSERAEGGLRLDRLEVFPTRVERFRACLLEVGDADHAWVRERIGGLSRELGTAVREELGEMGQLVVDLKD